MSKQGREFQQAIFGNKPEKIGGFDYAIQQLKIGNKVSRSGWNGKGMYITLINPGNAMHQGYPMLPCIGMKTADGNMCPGWLASQTDMLAEDWQVVN